MVRRSASLICLTLPATRVVRDDDGVAAADDAVGLVVAVVSHGAGRVGPTGGTGGEQERRLEEAKSLTMVSFVPPVRLLV